MIYYILYLRKKIKYNYFLLEQKSNAEQTSSVEILRIFIFQ